MKATKETIIEDFNELSELFDERIEEQYKVKGMQQCRHVYIYYRKLLWDIKSDVIDVLNTVK